MSGSQWREIRERNRPPYGRSVEEGAHSPAAVGRNPFGKDEDEIVEITPPP